MANTSDRSIVIGSKDFTENIVLAHLYGQMIEAHTDIDVDVEDNLGGTQVCYEALQAGEIDMYLDYNGNRLRQPFEPPCQVRHGGGVPGMQGRTGCQLRHCGAG